MATPKEVLEILLDPARREEEKKRQDKEREKRGHLQPNTPAEANYRFAAGRMENLLERMRLMAQERKPSKKKAAELMRAVAEAYALQGRFAEAALNSPDTKESKVFLAKKEALDKLDEERCQCPKVIEKSQPGNAKRLELPGQHPFEEIWDSEKRVVIQILKCLTCGIISAKTKR